MSEEVQPAEPVVHPRLRDVGLLAWVYYWVDLHGPAGTPSNAKVLSSTGYYMALPGVLVWGALEAANNGVGAEVVVALGLVLGMAFGLDGYKSGLKMRHGGKPEDS